MNRRAFLNTTALSAGLTACQTTGRSPLSETAAAAGVPPFELDELTIADLSAGIQSGRWTAQKLAELYLRRIEALNQKGPQLRAVIETNPDALEIARELDRERKERGPRGPLHGIPILVKDNIDTGDRMSTSAGSLALAGWRPPRDSFAAAKLRAAGAVILGKTNLSEWADFRSMHSVSGWSARGGQTRNPYALDRSPSGSSSGGAAGTAANLCAAALATETDGSIVGPASVNGLVGVKPTVGLISRTGIIPVSRSQDTPGPMARTVRDAALLLGALVGVDPDDEATAAARGKLHADYTKFLDAGGLKGARLGVAHDFYERHSPLEHFLSQCVDMLRHLGAVIIDPAELPSQGKGNATAMDRVQYEFKAGLNAYLSRLPAGFPRSLEELIAFNEKNRDREMPYFGQEFFIESQARGALSDSRYRRARVECERLSRAEGIDALVSRHKLDAVVSITAGPAWYIDWVNGDSDTGGCSTPAAMAGYPHVTVPAGLFRGLPVGLSFFGPAWSEPVLLRLAYAFEQNAQARPRPQFAASSPGPEKWDELQGVPARQKT